jgi:hypothetical protein
MNMPNQSGEVTNPMESQGAKNALGTQKELLFLALEETEKEHESVQKNSLPNVFGPELPSTGEGKGSGQVQMVSASPKLLSTNQVGGKDATQSGIQKGKQNKKYKKRLRRSAGSNTSLRVQLGQKRGSEPMEVDEGDLVNAKKMKPVCEAKNTNMAGLSEQPCKDQ